MGGPPACKNQERRTLQGGSVFSLSTHPAFITVTQGVQDAFHYLGATWRRWLPAAVAVAACAFVATAIFGVVTTTTIYHTDPSSGQIVANGDVSRTSWGSGAINGLAGLVAGWVFAATAIAGLRNRPLTFSFVVTRGLWALLATIVLGVLVGVGALAWILITVVVPPVGLLLLLAAIPGLIYLYIRVVFYNLAIFDGFGPIDGMKESWRLSNGSVMRLFGWGLMAALLAIVFGLAGGLVAAPFTLAKAEPVAQALSSFVSAIASCFTVFMLAVLYESERARKNPAAYGLVQAPNPYAPNPYAPNPYAAGPYAQGPSPYAQWPTPYAQAPNPYAPAPNPYAPAPYSPPPAWQGTPPPLQPWPAPQPPATLPYQGAAQGYPVSQPPQWGTPSAPPAWVSNPNVAPAPDQPAGTPPPGPAPTDPPTAG